MTPNHMYEQMERIANLMRASVRKSGVSKGLQPVQIEALHYLLRSNHYSNTPMAVAEFLGLTKGTVSQTLAVLENAGLVKKLPDPKDRRVVHLSLTDEGRSVLEDSIPPVSLGIALDEMAQQELKVAGTVLQNLLATLQKANGLKTFGACMTCAHHLKGADGSVTCNLTQETLAQDQHDKICREHTPSNLQ